MFELLHPLNADILFIQEANQRDLSSSSFVNLNVPESDLKAGDLGNMDTFVTLCEEAGYCCYNTNGKYYSMVAVREGDDVTHKIEEILGIITLVLFRCISHFQFIQRCRCFLYPHCQFAGIPTYSNWDKFLLHERYDDTGFLFLSISMSASSLTAGCAPVLGLLTTHLCYQVFKIKNHHSETYTTLTYVN